MHTIVALDYKKDEQFIINDATYTKINRVNGDSLVSFEIEYTQNNIEVFEKLDKRWYMRIVEDNHEQDYVVQTIYEKSFGNSIYLIVDALDARYDTLKREMVYKEHSGSKTRDAWFQWVMDGSSYKLDIRVGKQNAVKIESFGYDSRLSLLFQLLDKFGLEFYFTEQTIVIVDEIGDDKSDYISYGINLIESTRIREMSGFGTYGELFGAYLDEENKDKGRHHATYTHELAKVYGKLPIKPIVDERFTVKENMIAEIKKRVEASINISIEVNIDELNFFERGSDVYAGDKIMIIDPRVNMQGEIRIVESNVTRNHLGDYIDVTYTLGGYNEQYKSQTADTNMYNDILNHDKLIEDMGDKIGTVMEQAGGYGNIYRSKEEPTGPNLKHGDLWYQPYWNSKLGREETRMYQYEKEGAVGRWVLIGDSGLSDEIKEHVEELQKESDMHKSKIDEALREADDLLVLAEQARTNSNDAREKAKEAYDKAETSNKTAEEARKEAFDSKVLSEETKKDVSEVKLSVEEAKDSADKALEEATNVKDGLITINGKVEKQGLTINKLDDELQVQSAKVDANSTSVASLKLESDRIATEVVKTNEKVDGIEIGTDNLLTNSIVNVYNRFRLVLVKGEYNLIEYKSPENKAITVKLVGKESQYLWYLTSFKHSPKKILHKDNQYTMSFIVSSEKTGFIENITLNQATTVKANLGETSTTEKMMSVTFIPTIDSNLSDNMNFHFTASSKYDDINLNNSFTLHSFMLTEGTFPIDFNFPIEEQVKQSEVTKLSTQLEQTAEAVKIKADKTEVDLVNKTVKENKAQIEVHNEQIQLKASQSEVDKINDTVKLNESEIKLNSEQIKLQTSKIDNHSTEIANIKIESDKISTTVSKVEGDLENLEISTSNLLSNSIVNISNRLATIQSVADKKLIDYNSPEKKAISLKFSSLSGNILWYLSSFKHAPSKVLEKGKEYTMSFVIKSEKTGMLDRAWINQATVTKLTLGETSTSEKMMSVTFTPQIDSNLASNLNFHFGCTEEQREQNTNNEFILHSFMLTEGAVPMSFSLPVTEQATQVELSNVTQTVKGLQVTVQDKANQSEVTIMSNQLNSTIKRVDGTQSQINQQADLISTTIKKLDETDGKVTENATQILQLDNTIQLTVKEVETLGENVSSHETQINLNKNSILLTNDKVQKLDESTKVNTSEIKLLNNKIALKVEQSDYDKLDNIVKSQQSEIVLMKDQINLKVSQSKFDALNNKVGTHSSEITLLKDQVNLKVSKSVFDVLGNTVRNQQSQIKLLSDNIDLKVSKDKVVASINISPEYIRIDAKFIRLSGKSLIDDAVIKSAMIDTITASKITTGILNASNVNIINMNANNISTGYLSSDRIQARSIRADHLEAGAIIVGFNRSSTSIKLYGDMIEYRNGNTLTGRITSEGQEFWYGSRKVGHIGESYKEGDTNVRGIGNRLDFDGDFISWSYKKRKSDTRFTSMLTLDPNGKLTGKSGVVIGQDLYIDGDIGMRGPAEHKLKFATVRYNNYDYPSLTHSNGKTGIVFGSSQLYLIHEGNIYPMSKLIN